MKDEILLKINSVCDALDSKITVCGVKNAGAIAGCFMILQEVMSSLSKCEVTVKEQAQKNEG